MVMTEMLMLTFVMIMVHDDDENDSFLDNDDDYDDDYDRKVIQYLGQRLGGASVTD